MISEIRRIIFISGEHGSRLKRPSIDHMLNIRTNGRCFILNKQVKIFFPGPSILSIANRAGGGGGGGGKGGCKGCQIDLLYVFWSVFKNYGI